MTLTVSVGDFRNNISQYLSKVQTGNKVLIRNAKKGLNVAQVTKMHAFDKDSYQKKPKKGIGNIFIKNAP